MSEFPVKRFFQFVILACLMLFSSLAGAAPAKDNTGFNIKYIAGRKYYRASDIARYYRMRLYPGATRSVMTGALGRMVFNPQKRFGSFNNTVITYDFAPAWTGDGLYISSSDFFNHLQPLLNRRSLRRAGIRTIILDPGHGGKDRGAAGRRFTEKYLTLQVAKETKRQLERMGYRVLMTRVNDRQLTLNQRAQASNWAKADLFISIHMNAAANRSVRGIETFALTAPGAPSSGATKVAYNKYPGNGALYNSTSLAWFVQNSMVRATKAQDRGMKRARFVVLRETRCPSILVECGFISNHNDENLLGSAAYRRKLATAIAAGVRNYHANLYGRR